MFNKLNIAKKLVCQTLSLAIFLILTNIFFFGGGMLYGWSDMFSKKEGGIQVMAGLAPSSQTVKSLLRAPLPAKPARKFYT
jgi:hypothetical protein